MWFPGGDLHADAQMQNFAHACVLFAHSRFLLHADARLCMFCKFTFVCKRWHIVCEIDFICGTLVHCLLFQVVAVRWFSVNNKYIHISTHQFTVNEFILFAAFCEPETNTAISLDNWIICSRSKEKKGRMRVHYTLLDFTGFSKKKWKSTRFFVGVHWILEPSWGGWSTWCFLFQFNFTRWCISDAFLCASTLLGIVFAFCCRTLVHYFRFQIFWHKLAIFLQL